MFPYRPFVLAFLVLTAVSTLTWLLLPDYISDQLRLGIEEEVVWRADSPDAVYGRFERDNHPNDPPVNVSFYFFNITNTDEVQRGGKPHLQEVGPYVYQKHRQKVDIWFDRSGRVQYKEYVYLLHKPEGTLDPTVDQVITANVPLLGALEKAAKYDLEMILAGYIKTFKDPHNDGIFMTRSPHELLFGYEDPLLKRLAQMVPGLSDSFHLVGNMTSLEEAHHAPINVVNTGFHDLSKTWDTEMWSGVSEITCWNNHTEQVEGSDAFQFRPFLDENSTLDVWVGDLFRSARMVAKGWTELHGIKLLRFKPSEEQGEPNEKYFQYVKGLMNITAPTAVGPSGDAEDAAGPFVFMANPHFCNADPSLAANVSGLECHPDMHTTHIDVEPNTGITMCAAKRLMVVVQYGPRYNLVQPDLISTFLPVFWAEEGGCITQQAADECKDKVYGTQKLITDIRLYSFISLVACSSLFTITFVCSCFAWGMARHRSMIRKTSRSRSRTRSRTPVPVAHMNDIATAHVNHVPASPSAESSSLDAPLLGVSHPVRWTDEHESGDEQGDGEGDDGRRGQASYTGEVMPA